jgi:hypothetical protein
MHFDLLICSIGGVRGRPQGSKVPAPRIHSSPALTMTRTGDDTLNEKQEL